MAQRAVVCAAPLEPNRVQPEQGVGLVRGEQCPSSVGDGGDESGGLGGRDDCHARSLP